MCRKRFMEQLESYSTQVKEFFDFGEVQDLSKYINKAQILSAELELGMEKVCYGLNA